jgi:hypothetical protein
MTTHAHTERAANKYILLLFAFLLALAVVGAIGLSIFAANNRDTAWYLSFK